MTGSDETPRPGAPADVPGTAGSRTGRPEEQHAATADVGTPDERPNWLIRLLCGKLATPPPPTEPPEDATARDPDPTGVAALLAIATDTVADERERGRALDSKTASLAGFSGLILSVNGLFVGPVFKDKLGSIGGPLARIFFVAAVAFLLSAVLVSIVGVLMPQRYRGMGREQIRHFTARAIQAHNEMWVHQSMLGALADILDQDRPVNDCKAHLTKVVAWLLAFSFVFVAGEAITLGTQHVGI